MLTSLKSPRPVRKRKNLKGAIFKAEGINDSAAFSLPIQYMAKKANPIKSHLKGSRN